jgi:hypothetical protein
MATPDVQYLVLRDNAGPYLLARVHWPDTAQAISPGCSDWLDDTGLFDLPYEPSAVKVSLAEAGVIAADWGSHVPSGVRPPTPRNTFIRRMPADWSNLTPAERRAWCLDRSITRPNRQRAEKNSENGAETTGQAPAPSGLRRLRAWRASRRRQLVPEPGRLGPAGSGANGLPVDGSSAPLMIDLRDDQAGLLQSTISFRDDAGSGTRDGLTSMESDGPFEGVRRTLRWQAGDRES